MSNLEHRIELEKKFLIEYPDIRKLGKYGLKKIEIEQIYLLSSAGSHRIRKSVTNEKTVYTETVKVRINGLKCHEYEGEISESEYESLKADANPDKHPIIKDRYVFDYKEKVLEVDVYPFWIDKAVLEIELENEDEKYFIPPEITIIKDVSNDEKYKNNHLASIPYDSY